MLLLLIAPLEYFCLVLNIEVLLDCIIPESVKVGFGDEVQRLVQQGHGLLIPTSTNDLSC